ncbi:MAG: class I adenylate-forming enzyme family protein [Betaproteobacteria bacterium]
MNIADPIHRHARSDPHATAVIRRRGDTASYRDLDRTIDALAQRARDSGLAPGDVAVIAIASTYRLLVWSLALARLGVASAAASLPPEHADACLAERGREPVGRADVTLVEAEWTETPAAAASVPPVPAHDDGTAICRIFATSGTTGTPKHVAISHDLIGRRVAARQHTVLPDEPSVLMCLIGLSTTFGFVSILRTLWAGGRLVLARKPDEIIAAIDRHRVRCLVTAPATLADVLAALPPARGPLSSLARIEVGGSPLPSRLCRDVRMRLCANVDSCYGSVEAGAVAGAPMTAVEGRPGAVGFLLPGVLVQAVDDDGRPLPPGVEGELRMRSDSGVRGYVGGGPTDAGAFEGGWFCSGDVGSVADDGMLLVTGRKGDVINSSGQKIDPQAIEDVLLSMSSIREAAAFGVPDTSGVTQIWAAIVADADLDVAVLDAVCRNRLQNRAPKMVLNMASLPRNEGGKVMRDELVAMALAASRNPPGAGR